MVPALASAHVVNDLNSLLGKHMQDYCSNVAHRSSNCLKWYAIDDSHGGYPSDVITMGDTEDLQYSVE